jgi:hypothetical protein
MVVISDAQRCSRTRLKGEWGCREGAVMESGMVHGMAVFCPLLALIIKGKYWAWSRGHRGVIIITKPKWFRLKSSE